MLNSNNILISSFNFRTKALESISIQALFGIITFANIQLTQCYVASDQITWTIQSVNRPVCLEVGRALGTGLSGLNRVNQRSNQEYNKRLCYGYFYTS